MSSNRNRAFSLPSKSSNSDASDYLNNLRSKVKFAGTSNLARTVAAQGGMLPLRTPSGHLKPYQGTYGFSSTTNSPKTYCLNTSRSYSDLLDITKGKYLLTPPNPTVHNITLDDINPSELYNGVFFENVYKGNAEIMYDTTGFGIDNNTIIYTNGSGLTTTSNSNQLIFVDPSYNMFYESQSCLENNTYFRNIEIRTDLGVTGKEQLDRVLNLYLLNGFKYPIKFSLDYSSGDCINANNDLQTLPVPPPPPPPCPPISLDTIATEGPANTWTTNSDVTILPCQTLTILAVQTLNINNNFNNYGTIQNSGTILTNNGTFTTYSGGIINNNVGGVINTNVGPGYLQNDLGGTINNNGTIIASDVVPIKGTINNNATGLIYIQDNTLIIYGIITNNTGGVISVGSGVGIAIYGGILTNHIGATITYSGTIINDSTFTNYGIITHLAPGPSQIQNSGLLTNDGASATITNFSGNTIINLSGGTITNTNGATITNNSGATITNSSGAIINNKFSGIITNDAGATIANSGVFNNYVSQSAVFINNGTYTGNLPTDL